MKQEATKKSERREKQKKANRKHCVYIVHFCGDPWHLAQGVRITDYNEPAPSTSQSGSTK